MSGSTSPGSTSAPIFLHDDIGYAGLLSAIDGEIVIIEGQPVEVPRDIAEQLRPLVGQDVIVAQFHGQISVGALT
ncbi:MAG: hypothetical protein AB9879_09900 [Methanothrix sp.]